MEMVTFSRCLIYANYYDKVSSATSVATRGVILMEAKETVFKVYESGTETDKDGGSRQNMFGCDGEYHAVSTSIFDAVGDECPSALVTVTTGPCDDTCADGLADWRNRGSGFLHAVAEPTLTS